MDIEKKNQLIDAIVEDPNPMFRGADFAPFNWNARYKGGKWVSENHINGNPSQTKRGAYIDDGRPNNPVMIFDESGGEQIEIFNWWKQKHGENSLPDLFTLYNIDPPQRDPEQVKREQKQKTDTEKLLADIRNDFLTGDAGKDVRNYLTRPIEQGGRGWDAKTLPAMADFMGVVTDETARRLSEVTGLYFTNATAKTHPIVIYTFDRNGNLQYMKRRANGNNKKGGKKWGNIDSKKSGKGLKDADPFNYNNAAFLTATGSRTLVVVESELCAAHATIAGIKNVISISGSNGMSPKLAGNIVQRGCREIVLIFDTEGNDTKQGETNTKLLRTVNGLREQIEKITIRVATIPTEYNAKDPDELLSRHPDDGGAILQNIIDTAPTATEWQGRQLANRYKTADDDANRRQTIFDTINQAAALKEMGGFVAIEGERLINEFCKQSGTTIDAETMAQAANEKALKTARDKFNKTRENLLKEYDDARGKGDNATAADIINRLGHLTEPQSDPELNQHGKSFDDIANELSVDETATIETGYKLYFKRANGDYKEQTVKLPANGITYFAGGTGHGKSTMLQNVAFDILEQGKCVLYYGFEEVKRDTLFEFANIYIHKHVNVGGKLLNLSGDGSTQGINKYLRTKDPATFDGEIYTNKYENIESDNQQRIADAVKGFFKIYRGMDGGNARLFVYDDAFSSSELIDHIARVVPIAKPDAIFIDYIQFLQSKPESTELQQFEELGRVSKDLININKTHHIPIIVAAQLKEKNNTKSENYPDKFTYNDIFGASAIAQGAAAVYVLAKATRYPKECTVKYCGIEGTQFGDEHLLWMKLVKNRFGQDGGQGIFEYDGAQRYINPNSLKSSNDLAHITPPKKTGKGAKNNNDDGWED